MVTEQLKNDLIQNVYKDSTWGSYQYLHVEKQSDSQLSAYAYAKTLIPGDILSLDWVKDPSAEEK